MLKLFSVTNPIALVIIFIYDVIFRIGLFIDKYDYTVLTESKAPLARLFYTIVLAIPVDSRIVLGICAILIIYLQAIWLNQIVTKHKIFEKVGLLPAMLYMVFASMIPSFLICSGALLSMTFIILIIDKLFETFKREQYVGLIFDCGFLAGIAALFYFPNILLVLFIIIGLLTLHTFSIKDIAIILAGFLNPFFLVFTYYFWIDQPAYLWSELAKPAFTNTAFSFELKFPDIFGIGLMLILSIIVLINLPQYMRGSLIQFRKFMGLILILASTMILSVFLMEDLQMYHFVLLSLPVSISFFQILINFKRAIFGELSHIFLILSVLILQYLPYFYDL